MVIPKSSPTQLADRQRETLAAFVKTAELYTYQGVRPFVSDDKEDLDFYQRYLKGEDVMEEDAFFARAMLRKIWLKINKGFVAVGESKVFLELEMDRLVYQKNYLYAAALSEILRSPIFESQIMYGL